MKDKILNLVLEAVNEMNELLEYRLPIERKFECELYSKEGILDSISLVSLIVKVEEKIENNFGKLIILASEKAMSQKRSPFMTVGTLVNYIETIITEEVNDE